MGLPGLPSIGVRAHSDALNVHFEFVADGGGDGQQGAFGGPTLAPLMEHGPLAGDLGPMPVFGFHGDVNPGSASLPPREASMSFEQAPPPRSAPSFEPAPPPRYAPGYDSEPWPSSAAQQMATQ